MNDNNDNNNNNNNNNIKRFCLLPFFQNMVKNKLKILT